MPFDHGHALLIGVGTYSHIPWANVPITVTDAVELGKLLANPNFCGYPKDQITVLHDDSASRKKILQALTTLAQKTSEDDTVLIFYSGHGEYGTDGDYYLTTNDTRLSASNKIVKGSGIGETDLIEQLRQIKAKRLLLLLNACHSGEVSPSLDLDEGKKSFGSATLSLAPQEALLSTGEGRIIITACRPEQKSWLGNGSMTIFAQALADGLSGKGYVVNNSGYVSAFGLYEHVFLTVKESAGNLDKVQEPELTVLRNVGPFAISLYRGASDLGLFNEQEPVPAETAAREVSPEKSQHMLTKYVSKNKVAINNSKVGFVQTDWTIMGDVKQAGRDFYDGTTKKNHREPEGEDE